MKRKFTIKKINIGLDGCMHDYLSSFDCIDENGESIKIDPMVSGGFPETDEMSQEELLEWAEKQIGKTLFTDGISACEYVAYGKTYIV